MKLHKQIQRQLIALSAGDIRGAEELKTQSGRIIKDRRIVMSVVLS